MIKKLFAVLLILAMLFSSVHAAQVEKYEIQGSPLTMSELATALNSFFSALNTQNRGATAPTNATIGMLWGDNSVYGVENIRRYSIYGWRSLISYSSITGNILTIGERSIGTDTAGSIVDTNSVQGLSNKNFPNGLNVTGAPLRISSPITGVTSAQTETWLYAGGYTSTADSAAIVIRSKDHVTLPGTATIYAHGGETALHISNTGIVNASIGLQISGQTVDYLPSTPLTANGMLSGTLYISKIGNIVTLSWGSLTHSSNYAPETGSSFIPVGYRPVVSVTTVYRASPVGDSGILNLEILNTGLLRFTYRDWAGATLYKTATGSGTVSWISN